MCRIYYSATLPQVAMRNGFALEMALKQRFSAREASNLREGE
jgi:hypothetical protein